MFDGDPVWEASASIQTPTGPVPLAALFRSQRLLLVDKVRSLVDGIGDPDRGYWHTMSVAVHYRTAMRDDEQALLSAEWCAIPAVDVGGCEDRMTREPPW